MVDQYRICEQKKCSRTKPIPTKLLFRCSVASRNSKSHCFKTVLQSVGARYDIYKNQENEMLKFDKKKWRHRIIQIILFFCGVIGVHFLAEAFASSRWGDVLKSISQQDIDELLNDLRGYFFSTLLHLYILSFLLFTLLPNKIRYSKWWLRGIYFVFFYFLNILIYLWI